MVEVKNDGQRSEKDYGLTPVEKFMMIFGSFGKKTTVRSHEPHAMLDRQREGFDEAKREQYVIVEPFNNFGSIVIRCTDAGEVIAKAAYRKVLAAEFPAISKASPNLPSASQEGETNG